MNYLKNLIKCNSSIQILPTSCFLLLKSWRISSRFVDRRETSLSGLLLTFLFLLLTSYFLLSSCSQATENGEEGVTFSGTVTLEGETDFSGVTIGLYKLVELSSDQLEINQNYPNVGMEFTQQTEFYHREHDPVYTKLTDNSGNWQIENVSEGQYHIVAEKEGFGWQVIYNSTGTNDGINMNKVFKLSGDYFEDVLIKSGRFVEIETNVFFRNNATLSIESGVILEFMENSSLSIEGNFICQGNVTENVRIIGSGPSHANKITVKNSEICNISHVNVNHLKNGLFFSAIDLIDIDFLVVKNCDIGLEIFNCGSLSISNSNITKTTNAVNLNNTNGNFNKNIISDISTNGVEVINTDDINIYNNLIKNCDRFGIASNDGGYSYQNTFMNIMKNDLNANATHIYIGPSAGAKCNYNNFYNESNKLVITSHMSKSDTLNFNSNYWGYFIDLEIGLKITDRIDTGNGALIDYSDYLNTKYNWQGDI